MSKLSAIRILMTLCLLLTGTSALFSQIVSTTAGMRFSIISKSQKTCTLKSISYLDEQDVVIPDTVEINGEKYKGSLKYRAKHSTDIPTMNRLNP